MTSIHPSTEPAPTLRPPFEGFADLSEFTAPDGRVWIAVAVAAIGTDLAVRSGVIGLAGTALVAVVATSVMATGRAPNVRSWPFFGAAGALGVFLTLRASPWILPLDILVIAGLLVLGATYARSGDPFDLTVPGLLGRGLHAVAHGLMAPGFLMRGHRRRPADEPARRWEVAAVGRGLLLAIPIVIVITALLASADAVFASLFRPMFDTGDALRHLVLLAVGAWGAAGLLRLSSAAPFTMGLPERRPLGTVEAITVLGALVAVFLAFAASQAVAMVRGAAYVERTAGLTYAEYARSGFFQLLGVAAITLATLLAVRGASRAATVPHGWFVFLSEAAVVLTLMVVAIAIRRLGLYEKAYGLTMLRLCSLLFAFWIGAVFVLVGVALGGVGRTRNWLVPAVVAAALVGLLAVNVAPLETFVVHRNVARFAGTDKLDVGYLDQLSADAVPALVDALPRLSPDQAKAVLGNLCARPQMATGGFWAFNASRHAAMEARHRVCSG